MDNEDQRELQALSTSVTELNQVSSGFSMAMALQERKRLATIESESSNEEEEVDEESEVYSNDQGAYYDYFESHNFDSLEAAELQFLEEQDSNSDDDDDSFMDDVEIDVDELTYEELIALGEFIGQEKRGLSMNEIPTCLHACKYYCSSVETKSGIDRCVICQVEYEEGESTVALLPCEHPYHSECISNWLQVKKICPICSTEVSPVTNTNVNVITTKL